MEPHGFLKLGLYSETAREYIVKAREFIKEKNYKSTSKDIKTCRQDFISEEMFDSVNENREIKEDESDNLEPLFSPQEDIQPSLSIGYTVNNRELCKKYGSVYSSHCNKLLR